MQRCYTGQLCSAASARECGKPAEASPLTTVNAIRSCGPWASGRHRGRIQACTAANLFCYNLLLVQLLLVLLLLLLLPLLLLLLLFLLLLLLLHHHYYYYFLLLVLLLVLVLLPLRLLLLLLLLPHCAGGVARLPVKVANLNTCNLVKWFPLSGGKRMVIL